MAFPRFEAEGLVPSEDDDTEEFLAQLQQGVALGTQNFADTFNPFVQAGRVAQGASDLGDFITGPASDFVTESFRRGRGLPPSEEQVEQETAGRAAGMLEDKIQSGEGISSQDIRVIMNKAREDTLGSFKVVGDTLTAGDVGARPGFSKSEPSIAEAQGFGFPDRRIKKEIVTEKVGKDKTRSRVVNIIEETGKEEKEKDRQVRRQLGTFDFLGNRNLTPELLGFLQKTIGGLELKEEGVRAEAQKNALNTILSKLNEGEVDDAEIIFAQFDSAGLISSDARKQLKTIKRQLGLGAQEGPRL